MDNISLVTTALEYFDENSGKYDSFLRNIRYVKFIEAESDMEHNTVHFFDKSKNEIFRSRYEIIGVYDVDSNTWTWSWAISKFKKNNTYIARKLWNYGVTLDPSVRYLKTELITSRFRVADFIQLDIHAGIASYISKVPLVYKYAISFQQTKDSEGYIPISKNDQTVYYMFLLDHANLKVDEENNNCNNY